MVKFSRVAFLAGGEYYGIYGPSVLPDAQNTKRKRRKKKKPEPTAEDPDL